MEKLAAFFVATKENGQSVMNINLKNRKRISDNIENYQSQCILRRRKPKRVYGKSDKETE